VKSADCLPTLKHPQRNGKQTVTAALEQPEPAEKYFKKNKKGYIYQMVTE
jgi:hypothetical protein